MRGGEGRLTASRDAPVGGQAVLEGVMMRGITTWAVAVRKPAAEDDDAALGPIASRLGWGDRATVFYRFLSLNVAAVVGLWLWLRGRVPVTWEPSGL